MELSDEALRRLYADEKKSMRAICREYNVKREALTTRLIKLGLHIPKSVTEVTTKMALDIARAKIAETIYRNSETFFEDGINYLSEAKRMLSNLNVVIEMNKQHILDGSADTAKQRVMIEAVAKYNSVLQSLVGYEEKLVQLQDIQRFKTIVLHAIQSATPELARRINAEIKHAEYLFRTGRPYQPSNNGSGVSSQELTPDGPWNPDNHHEKQNDPILDREEFLEGRESDGDSGVGGDDAGYVSL